MSDVRISTLPAAGTITGAELVPVVQNGTTVQTTVSAIATSPTQTYTYLTVNSTANLPNSRSLAAGSGLSLSDGGAQGSLAINTTGALLSLVSTGVGIQAKTNTNTLTNVSIAVGTGLSISNANGSTGNPTIALSGIMSNLAATTGTGLLGVNGTVITPLNITGSASITVANGTGAGGNPTLSISASGVAAGAYTLPSLTLDTYGRATSASSASTTGTGSVVLSNSPTLTGTPLAPTASINTNTTQLATTAFVLQQISFSGGGTVVSVAVNTANGFSAIVVSPTYTPTITIQTTVSGLLKGNGTAVSAAVSGTDYAPATSGSSILYGNGSGGFSNVSVGSGLSFNSGTLSSTNSGTVTSVGFTGGIVSVATPTTTPAFTVAGTSGGVVYFSSASTWASSALLAANAIVIGGGAGAAPATTTTGAGVVTALGNTTNAASGIVVKDANSNVSANNFLAGFTSTVSAGTTTTLTVASTQYQLITGSTSHTFQLPNATTMVNGATFSFNNNSSAGTVSINNGAGSPTLIASVGSGGYVTVTLLDNSTQAGSWDYHFQAPSNTTWTTNTLNTGSAITSTQTVQGTRLISTIATGTAPLTVTSTTQVANLNAATAGTATNATNVALTAGTGATNYLTFSATATGNQPINTNTSLTYNYTNNALTAGVNGGTF